MATAVPHKGADTRHLRPPSVARLHPPPEMSLRNLARLLLHRLAGARFRAGRNVVLGAGVRLARGTLIDARAIGVSIGDGVVSGAGVTVLAVNEIARSTRAGSATQTDAMTIGSGAWLGAHCLITAGVQVGAGAVVAAEALVIDDVPDRAIVSGTPARVVGRRGADDALEFFLTSVEARDTTRGRLQKPATP